MDKEKTEKMEALLEVSAEMHRHLCPRQILGVRMGMLAGDVLGMELPQKRKNLFVFMEADGCGADGVSVATNAWVGRRTMRIEDYGKVAATFVNVRSGQAIRIAPKSDVREQAKAWVPNAKTKWFAYMDAYKEMPDEMMFNVQPVKLRVSLKQIISRANVKAICDGCQEEILNERELFRSGQVLCKSCAGEGYYEKVVSAEVVSY